MSKRIPFSAFAATAALALLTSVGAHADDRGDNPTQNSATDRSQADYSQAGAASDNNRPTDAQIAKAVMTANEGEIDQAKYVMKNTKNPKVKQFAQHMVQAHKSNNQQAKQLTKKTDIKPEDSETSKNLQSDAKDTLSNLKDNKGTELDRAYMEAQVKDHQKVLDSIDKQFLPNAKNPQLRSMLEKTRTDVNQHLRQAKQIQSSLESSTG